MGYRTPEDANDEADRDEWSLPRPGALRPLASRWAKGIAEMIDPVAEEAYWRENYNVQPYYESGYSYEDYHAAYRTGWEGRAHYEGRRFEEVEHQLQKQYSRYRGKSPLEWNKARAAARAAWDRFDANDAAPADR